MRAFKIDHSGVKLPAPNEKVIDAMAMAGYQRFRDWTAETGGQKPVDWMLLPPVGQAAWESIARSMYGSLAAQAGGKVTKIA